MRKVLIPTKLDKTAAEILQKRGYCVVQDSETEIGALVAQNSDAEAIIVRSEKVGADLIDALPQLKTIVRAGAGFNTIDIKYARKKGVDVMNTPGANSNSVAEEVVAMALAAYRFVVPGDISTRAGGWEKKKFMGHEVTGKTLGIVGLGNIGQLVVRRFSGFDMKFLGYDPIVSAAKAEELGVKLVSIEDIFRDSDIITLHIPENDETRGMVNARLLSLVKPGVVLINCARSGIVNEDDLRTAKATKKLVYCNDVYPKDEAGPKSIADVADVMLPHLGANTHEANFNAAKRSAEQIIEYFENGVTRYIVNKDLPDGLDANYQKLANRLALLARACLGRKTSVRAVRCSFYGDLAKFDKWFLPPIAAALSGVTDSSSMGLGPHEAEEYLQQQGISVEFREPASQKQYGNSMTIDLEGDGGKASVRGTITENNLLVSRINDFEHLYFMPTAHAFLAEYWDRPGVLASICTACAKAGLNIEDIHAPRDPEGKRALAILMTDQPVSPVTVEAVKTVIDPINAFAVELPQ